MESKPDTSVESKPDTSVKNIQNFLTLHYIVYKTASDLLREKFREKWKAFHNSEWTEQHGKLFTKGMGQNVFKSSKRIQREQLTTGNITAWDLPLIIQCIKCLDKEDVQKYDGLTKLRNELAHQPTTEIPDDIFQKYWHEACQILLSFGVSQEVLDEAKNVKFLGTEVPLSENSYISEVNSTEADELKAKGNKFYAVKQYDKAIEAYSKAIELPGIPLQSLAFLYSNRSLMHLELHDLSSAKEDAKGAIHIHPTWWRGYARLAKSYEELEKFEKAIKYYELALQMNPPPVHKEELVDSLYFCRRMFGKIDRMENIQPGNFINTVEEMIDDANKNLGKSTTPFDLGNYHIGQELIYKSDVLKSNPFTICAEGHKFLRGIGVPQNFELAATRFAKAASNGSADGQYNLGALLLEGKGIKRNTQMGIDMFRQAAAQPSFTLLGKKKLTIKNEGVSEAKHALGLAYYEGSGVPKNIKTAFSWWSRAVDEDGNGASANNIGCMYEEGELGVPNIEKAILYWKFASFDDLVRAMVNLYRVHMIKGKHDEAFNWYRLSIHNKSVRDAQMDKIFAARQSEKFDPKAFVEKMTKELKCGEFGHLVVRHNEMIKNMSQLSLSGSFPQPPSIMPKCNVDFIIEHRTWFNEMLEMKKHKAFATYAHPAKLMPKKNVDIFGLKPILFKNMDVNLDKIYEGFAVKVTIIDDATLGQPSVNLIGQDDDGYVKRLFIYNIPQNDKTQDVVGYGCVITIVNPYHRIGTCDGLPGIRIDDPSTVIYHTTLTNKKRCRYCGNPQGKIVCKKCMRAFYCSENCLKRDASEYQHKLVCVKI